MKYITGTYALNLPSALGTPGDWHQSALNWEEPRYLDTDDSVFGDWGIEDGIAPGLGKVKKANHIRACLDLIDEGYYSSAQGMRKDFIDEEQYTNEVFIKVSLLKNKPNWDEIDRFMGREYLCDWLDYKELAGL